MTAREEMGALFAPLEAEVYAVLTDVTVEAYLARCAIEEKWSAHLQAVTAAAAQHREEIQ